VGKRNTRPLLVGTNKGEINMKNQMNINKKKTEYMKVFIPETGQYVPYEQWTVAQLDEDNMKIGEEEFEEWEDAMDYYIAMVCEWSPKLGARLSYHTHWEMIDGVPTSNKWTTIDTHEAGRECLCNGQCVEVEE